MATPTSAAYSSSAAPVSPDTAPSTEAPVEDRVTAVALDLVERGEASPLVKKVRISKVVIGGKSLTFDFSVRSKGVEAPVEEKALKQLALGCKRSLMSKHVQLLSQLRQLEQIEADHKAKTPGAIKFTKNHRKLLNEVRQQLKTLANIQSFSFRVKANLPIVVVEGLPDASGKPSKMELTLDPEYNGVAQLVKTELQKLERQEDQLNQDLDQIHRQISQQRHFLNAAQQHLAALEADHPVHDLFTEAPDFEAMYSPSATEITEQQRLNTQISRLKHTIEELQQNRLDKEEALSLCKRRSKALRDQERHKVEIRKQAIRDGSAHIFVPKLVIEIPEHDGSTDYMEQTLHLPYFKFAVLYYDHKVATHGDLLMDITNRVEEARKGTLPEQKEFDQKLKEKENAQSSQANMQRDQMMQRMAAATS